jgi:hypothetical protein
MNVLIRSVAPPPVRVAGRADYWEFDEAMALLRASAQIVESDNPSPELTIIAQSRPGEMSGRQVELLQRGAPLSGTVALLGSWCEGETRTGCPWPGIRRLYWHEFPAWWRRQLALRAAGRCPDWARPGESGPLESRIGSSHQAGRAAIGNRCRGLILLGTSHRDTADALSDVVLSAGYCSVWHPPGRQWSLVSGASAGIWEGGQLDDREEAVLRAFCRASAREAAPVVALLDFPRRDRVERARLVGAAAVLGKPWLNEHLVATIDDVVHRAAMSMEPAMPRAA